MRRSRGDVQRWRRPLRGTVRTAQWSSFQAVRSRSTGHRYHGIARLDPGWFEQSMRRALVARSVSQVTSVAARG